MSAPLFIIAALALLIAGIAAIVLSRRAWSETRLPAGQIIYSDASRWQRAERPLFSRRHQLAGKPDYVVRQGRAIIPVEVKSSRAPTAGPREGHVLQLAAYCLLVEETEGARPAYGLIKYADQTFRVDNTLELTRTLLATLDAMRHDMGRGQSRPSHTDPARCRRCGVRASCEERLD